MTPTHFGPNGPRPHTVRTAGNSGLAAVEEQVERIVRLAAAMERVCTEILLRISWLEADVKRLAAREREP